MTIEVHEMECAYQQTGHYVLTCPKCGYSVQIDARTLERKTLDPGQMLLYHHVYSSLSGLSLGVSGSAKPPSEVQRVPIHFASHSPQCKGTS